MRFPLLLYCEKVHIESFHRLLKYECLDRYGSENYSKAYDIVTSYLSFYNERRIHSSIGNRSPTEFYQKRGPASIAGL